MLTEIICTNRQKVPLLKVGDRVNRWTIISKLPSKGIRAYCKVLCECGNYGEILVQNILNGSSKSCGCLRLEIIKKDAKHYRITHAKAYRCWADMKNRCNSESSTWWPSYGGRGIRVCDRWEYFENFLADMGTPGDSLSLDRIDNEKGYYPANCRWADATQQANNMRSNVFTMYKGKQMTLAEYSRVTGENYNTVTKKLRREGRVMPYTDYKESK